MTMATARDDELGTALLTIARQAIGARLGAAAAEDLAAPELPELEMPAATFVTLSRNGELRGCIGSLEAHRPLRLDVAQNACAAAFRDARFAPVGSEEWPQVRVEVSLLDLPEPVAARDEAELRRQLRPGIDGVILRCGSNRATLLPQVWDELPEVADFLTQLKQKAGLPAHYWSSEIEIQRYRVRKWKEQ